MNGKIILAILVAISGAVGYVFYTSSQSEWNEVSESEPVVEPVSPTAEPEPEFLKKVEWNVEKKDALFFYHCFRLTWFYFQFLFVLLKYIAVAVVSFCL